MCRWEFIIIFFLVGWGPLVYAQSDTEKKPPASSYLARQKGLLYELAKSLLTDTTDNSELRRNDELFQQYEGRIIRRIQVQTLDFGVSITDTTRFLKNKLITISNKIHQQTRNSVIRNHLFFAENQRVSPFRMADNEKHLRDLSFLQDARIHIEPVVGSSDSVDVIILTKDMLSLGGSLNIHSNESAGITVKEDNLFGWGDHLQLQTFYDLNRDQKFGYGFSYIKRNIGGSFINAAMAHMNFDETFTSGEKEERVTYLRLEKPLVNRYMRWKYGLEASVHQTQNMYSADTAYRRNFAYKYHILDAYAAWNIDADKKDRFNNEDRLRRLVGFRFLNQKFAERPMIYPAGDINRYADITALLGDISLFKQNFYKTHHIYGFGRNEDVPEGGGASVTTGYTKINSRERLYFGMNFQRYYFNRYEHYFNYTLRSGAYLYKNKLEDINMLASLEYFTRLYQLDKNWKHRMFLNVSLARQIKSVFNDPLLLESAYGLPDLKNNGFGGSSRFTMKAESVFFSPLSVFFFRFAPFISANASVLKIKVPYNHGYRVYSSLGGGLRIRNESLIFKTIELKGMYFPNGNFYNERWRFEIGTNIRFKYNHEFIRRPEFVNVN